MTKSVLTIGDHPQTLAVVRSLGRAGYNVIVGHEGYRAVAALSRYCGETWSFAGLRAPSFADELAGLLSERDDIACLFPIGERAIEHVQRAVRHLGLNIPVAAVSRYLLEGCVDKVVTNEMARRAGIRVPQERIVHNQHELVDAAAALGYPLIVKSLRSEALVLGRKAYLVADQSAFAAAFGDWPGSFAALLVQQYVSGTKVGCDFVAKDGEIVAYYHSFVDRTDMPDGTGFAVSFTSRSPEADLFGVLQAFVHKHGYSGPGLLQCIRCAQTRELYFIEMNPRLSAGTAEAVTAGVDLPLTSVRVACGDLCDGIEHAEQASYRVGSHTHWLERDALGLLRHFHGLEWRDRARWLAAIFRDALRNDGHINWQWRDPLPSMLIMVRLLRSRLWAGAK